MVAMSDMFLRAPATARVRTVSGRGSAPSGPLTAAAVARFPTSVMKETVDGEAIEKLLKWERTVTSSRLRTLEAQLDRRLNEMAIRLRGDISGELTRQLLRKATTDLITFLSTPWEDTALRRRVDRLEAAERRREEAAHRHSACEGAIGQRIESAMAIQEHRFEKRIAALEHSMEHRIATQMAPLCSLSATAIDDRVREALDHVRYDMLSVAGAFHKDLADLKREQQDEIEKLMQLVSEAMGGNVGGTTPDSDKPDVRDGGSTTASVRSTEVVAEIDAKESLQYILPNSGIGFLAGDQKPRPRPPPIEVQSSSPSEIAIDESVRCDGDGESEPATEIIPRPQSKAPSSVRSAIVVRSDSKHSSICKLDSVRKALLFNIYPTPSPVFEGEGCDVLVVASLRQQVEGLRGDIDRLSQEISSERQDRCTALVAIKNCLETAVAENPCVETLRANVERLVQEIDFERQTRHRAFDSLQDMLSSAAEERQLWLQALGNLQDTRQRFQSTNLCNSFNADKLPVAEKENLNGVSQDHPSFPSKDPEGLHFDRSSLPRNNHHRPANDKAKFKIFDECDELETSPETQHSIATPCRRRPRRAKEAPHCRSRSPSDNILRQDSLRAFPSEVLDFLQGLNPCPPTRWRRV